MEPSLCNKLFHKRLIAKILQDDLLDRTLKINEDLMMNVLLFRESDLSIYEDFCPYHYLTRTTSATRTSFQESKALDPVKVWKWILEQAEPELREVAWRKYLVTCSSAYTYLAGHPEYKDKRKELKRTLKDNHDKWPYLTRNEQIKLRLMLTSAGLYRLSYGLYERTIQRKVYE